MPLEDASPGPDLSDLELALGSLAPTPLAARDRILFEAGRASGMGGSARRLRGVWPSLAAGFGLIALGEAALLARRPTPEVVVRTVVVREPALPQREAAPTRVVDAEPVVPLPPAPSFAPMTARDRLNDQILRFGLDGLPAPTPNAAPVNRLPLLSGRDLLRQELRSALFSGDHS